MTEITRPQTDIEKNMTPLNSEGDTTGFVDLMKPIEDLPRQTIIQQINNRNRSILLNSEKPLDEIKKLSCAHCYEISEKANLIENLSFKQIFQKFQGRRELDKVIFRNIKATQSDIFETSATIRLLRCPYCHKKSSISFLNLDMTPEIFEDLKLEANKHVKLDVGSW